MHKVLFTFLDSLLINAMTRYWVMLLVSAELKCWSRVFINALVHIRHICLCIFMSNRPAGIIYACVRIFKGRLVSVCRGQDKWVMQNSLFIWVQTEILWFKSCFMQSACWHSLYMLCIRVHVICMHTDEHWSYVMHLKEFIFCTIWARTDLKITLSTHCFVKFSDGNQVRFVNRSHWSWVWCSFVWSAFITWVYRMCKWFADTPPFMCWAHISLWFASFTEAYGFNIESV